jgi:hypothetical protein
MARLDWDRVRRNQPLDGADARVDPDGAVLWEREVGPARDADASSFRERLDARSGVRRLRAGIVVRRARERREDGVGALGANAPAPAPPRSASVFDTSAWIECPRCKVRVLRRTLLLHARASCARRA